MKNKASKIILTVVFAEILIFGASFAKATTNEGIVKALQSLIQVLIRMLNQLFAQRGSSPVTTITVPLIPTTTTLVTSSTKLNVCTTVSGKYSMTLEEAINLFKNSECKSLGDPNKLPISCYQCDPKTIHGDLYHAVYGEDNSLSDRAAYEIGGCTINIKDKRAYINKGPSFCTGSTDVTYLFAIVCAMRNTPKEGWYYIEGPDAMYMNSTSSQKVLKIELLKSAKCSNCQLICSDDGKTITYTDSCTKSVIASHGGEFSCKGPIEVSPKDSSFIENLIRTALPNITPCIDSDGGQNIYAKGTTKDSRGTQNTDICESSDSLVEYYCLNNYVEMSRLTCPNGYYCQDGACIPGVTSHLFVRVQGEIGDKNETLGETPFGYGIKLPINQIGGFQISIFKDGSVLDPTTPGLTVEWSPEGLINHFVKDTLQLNEHYRREVAYYQFAQPGVRTIKCCVTYSNDTYCNDLQIEVIK